MGEELDKLLKRLKRILSAFGKKAELAEYLKVPRPRVSEWLSGAKEPGGETTLRLLAWVAAEEATQQKSPGRASTRPEPKARKRKSRYENRKSSRS